MPLQGIPSLFGGRRGASAVVCNPADISGLQLRLKGDDAVTGNITTWPDSSGQGNDATATGLSGVPVGVANVINGHKIVRFVAANSQYFTFSTDFCSGFTAGEIFVVIQIVADPPPLDGHTGLYYLGGDFSTHYPYSDGIIYDGFGTTSRKTVGDPTPSLSSTFRLYNPHSGSGDWQAFLDGTSIFSTGTNTVSFVTVGGPLIGKGLAAYFPDGDIAEILFYNKVLTSTERGHVNSYVADTYALTIANTVSC